jgi:nicotinamidase-related amidase
MMRYTMPEFSSAALITIDTQRDTLDGQQLEIPGTSAALPNIGRIQAACRKLARPIVHIVRLYKPDGSNVDLCRREAVEEGAPVFLPGSAGSELALELLPEKHQRLDARLLLAGEIQKLGPREVAMYKPRWGAFYQTTLEAHLRDMATTTVVFCGCNFPNCPRTSIYEASERDFRVVLAQDAISGLYAKGCSELTNIGVAVLPTSEIIRELERSCQQSVHS